MTTQIMTERRSTFFISVAGFRSLYPRQKSHYTRIWFLSFALWGRTDTQLMSA